MKTTMQVDTVALLQGVFDARDEKLISPKFAESLHKAIYSVSLSTIRSRSFCKYDELMTALSTVEPEDGEDWYQLSSLWKDYLGKSLASGITVRNS